VYETKSFVHLAMNDHTPVQPTDWRSKWRPNCDRAAYWFTPWTLVYIVVVSHVTLNHRGTVGLRGRWKWTRHYARKQLLLSARLSHRSSVRPSVCLSVCHTGGSVKNGASYDHQIFTFGCLGNFSFRNRKAFP